MADTMAPTVGDLAAAFLEAQGVQCAFGVVSVHNIPILDAINRRGRIRFVTARGEAGATNMADAASRVSGKLGAVVTSTGTGAGNAAGALVEAATAGTPLLHLTGQVDLPFLDKGFGYLHEAPAQLAMLKAVSKAAYQILSPGDALNVLQEAATVAMTAPHGPVSIEIPIDIQRAAVALPSSFAPLAVPAQAPDAKVLDRLADGLAKTRRPLLWIGGGARAAGVAVRRLAELGIGVVTSSGARGVLPDDHPMSLGGYGASPQIEALYDTSDFMIVAGSHLRSNETRTLNLRLPLARARIDVDPKAETRSYPCEIFVEGDAALALGGLADRLTGRLAVDPAWGPDVLAARRAAEAAMRKSIAPYEPMLAAVETLMPRDAIWVRDITLASTMWGARAPVVRDPRAAVHAMGGGIGQGLPMAVGAAVAGGGRKTVALVGDGGLALNLGEMATAAESGADIAMILMNDGGYGVIRNIQDNNYGGRRCYADLKTPSFGLVAESLGIPYRKITELPDFAPAFAAAVQATGFSIVEIDMAAIGPFASRGGNFPPPPASGMGR